MEKYIRKINDKVLAKNDEAYAKKAKKIYRGVGYGLLGVGLLGFAISFVVFFVLFFKYHTEQAFTAWIVAVPFLLMLVPGSVCARVGDMLLTQPHEEKKKEEGQGESLEEEK